MNSVNATLRLVQEIAKLVRARLPLGPALGRLANLGSVPVGRAASDLVASLDGGASLRDALTADQSKDSKMLAAAIDVGEAAGKLEASLESWANYILAGMQHRTRLMSALLYPVALTLIAVCSVTFCVYTLVPQYEDAFRILADERPNWLSGVTWVREHLGLFVSTMISLMVMPITWTIYQRWRYNRWGLPQDAALRLYTHAHAARLASLGVGSTTPVPELIPTLLQGLSASSSAASDRHAAMVVGKETMAILASLQAESLSSVDAQALLNTLANQLQLAGDFASDKDARWLPMLVSLVVGFVVAISYILLIYLPWIVLFCYISTSTHS